jgi:hypothetical protein
MTTKTTALPKRERGRPRTYPNGTKAHNLTLPVDLVPVLKNHLKQTGESLPQLFLRLLTEDLQRYS